MNHLSVCIEMLFKPELEDVPARFAAAREAGADAVEFWSWRNKDIDALDRARVDTGLAITGFLVDPRQAIVDPATHESFLTSVRETLPVAQRLGASALIVVVGDERPGVARAAQHDAIVRALQAAAPLAEDAGVTLVLEPLNTAKDHGGYFLHSTAEGLDIVEQVGSPAVRLLYDVYHSVMMGEDASHVVGDRARLIGHVHIADAPGRQEPGTGRIDFAQVIGALRSAGYAGPIGLEFRPSGSSAAAIAAARRVLP